MRVSASSDDQAIAVVLLEPFADRDRIVDDRRSAELHRRQVAAEIDQRERIAPGGLDDPRRHRLADGRVDRAAEQLGRRVGFEPVRRRGGATRRATHRRTPTGRRTRTATPSARIRRAANASECNDSRVEPLGVVHADDDAGRSGDRGQQRQQREPDEPHVDRLARLEAERDRQHLAVTVRQLVEAVEIVEQQPMQSRVPEGRLGLDADHRPHDRRRHARRRRSEEGRLADAGIADDDQALHRSRLGHHRRSIRSRASSALPPDDRDRTAAHRADCG